jgi:hypothetical protein
MKRLYRLVRSGRIARSNGRFFVEDPARPAVGSTATWRSSQAAWQSAMTPASGSFGRRAR